MKKIKQMRIKAILLTIVAVLTLGFTSCTDELASDQTQGKPGYLTLNLKTLKPKQTKTSTDLALDYQKITNLNVMIYRSNSLILKKYYTTQTGGAAFTSNGVDNIIQIPVGAIDIATDKVVVIANYGDIPVATDISTMAALNAIVVPTVGDFPNGLIMTGIADITGSGTAYSSQAKIAPIISKISVKWNTLTGDAAYYDITGIYIVNAVNSTKLPLILNNGVNNAIASLLTPTSKTASSGYDVTSTANARNYNIYAHTLNVNAGILSDTVITGGLTSTLYSYYVGENYHGDLPTGTGILFADATVNTGANANTIILIKATPKATGVPAWITNGGVRYYTYDLNASLATSLTTPTSPNAAIPTYVPDGFSTRRKTNYIVTFNLNNIGTQNPFERALNTLTVTVTASPWDDAPTSTTF